MTFLLNIRCLWALFAIPVGPVCCLQAIRNVVHREVARWLRLQAVLWWVITVGQQAQARTALSTAIELYRAIDMTFWLPQAEAALAQVEGP
jgi:hypothetical protein